MNVSLTYSAFGLGIQSALALPELIAADVKADARITLGSVSLPPQMSDEDGIGFYIAPQEAFFHWPTIGDFAVRGGSEIVIDPLPDVDESAVRIFLLGTIMAMLLHQRGLTVFHSSAVAVDGLVAAFMADKGYGKSTTAATLYARGHPLVSDDIVALDLAQTGQRPTVLPAYPQFKLLPESLASLGHNPDGLPRLRADYEKRAWRLHERFSQTALPLGAVFILGEGDALHIDRLAPQQAMLELLRFQYASRFGSAAFKHNKAHFQQCAHIAQAVPVYYIARRYDLAALDEIAQRVEQCIRSPHNGL